MIPISLLLSVSMTLKMVQYISWPLFSEASCHFLAVLCFSQIPLRQVVIKRHCKIMQEEKMVLAVLFQPVQQCGLILFCILMGCPHVLPAPLSYQFMVLFLIPPFPCSMSPFLARFISHNRLAISDGQMFPVSSVAFFRYRMMCTLHSACPVPKW